MRLAVHQAYHERSRARHRLHPHNPPTYSLALSMSGSMIDDFAPKTPIRVRLVADEETPPPNINASGDVDAPDVPDPRAGADLEMGRVVIRPPPPAYGRWRDSVRANPDLLHWQRVHMSGDKPEAVAREDGQAPPSYVSRVEERNGRVEQSVGEVPMQEMEQIQPWMRRAMGFA